MNTITPEIKEFILWFLRNEQIPLQTRKDMCAHLVEVQTLDAKTLEYMDQIIAGLMIHSWVKRAEIEQRWQEVRSDIERADNPETDDRNLYRKEAVEEIDHIMEDYKETSKPLVKTINQEAEDVEHTAEEQTVEDIKASIA